PAGTSKSYIIHLLIEDFKKIGRNYLLMAPTRIVIQNIGGLIIHSALRIASNK
ncbi:11805_t:CDS:1, partial [Dentiscutata heterogama]